MDMPPKDKSIYAFGPFRLDPIRRSLLVHGATVTLTARLFEALLYLVQNPERLVTRDELENAVWRGRVVEEGNLHKAVSSLRKALQSEYADEGLIVTVPGRGYQFASPVSLETGEGSGPVALQLWSSGGSVPRLAKLSRPELPETVARPRLFDLLERYRKRKIVWVAGPPGAGKTTLVSSFLQDRKVLTIPIRFLWYVVDTGDGDPASFFYYMRELARAESPHAAELPLLTAEYLQDIPGFTRHFFRILTDRLPGPFLLVLDNFQDAGAMALDDILRDAAGQLCVGSCIVVISRQDPPAAFARLRANQELAVLDFDELRLTEVEATEIVTLRNPHLAAEAPAIHARSGGWAAGLTLLLETPNATDATRAEDAAADPSQVLFDYFATELFESAPRATQRIWLTTACLPRFTGAVAALLSGEENAGHVLDALARRRTFTDRHVASDIHYQYHALFREFLLQQLSCFYSLDQRRDVVRRCARAAEDTDDTETALALYEQSGDSAAAATLFLARAPVLFAQGRWQTLQGWLERQRPERLQGKPWLHYWLAKCQSQRDPRTGRVTMEIAYNGFSKLGELDGELLAVCAIIENQFVDWTDIEGVDPWIELLKQRLAQEIPWQSADLELRAHAALLGALAHTKPQDELIPTCISRVWQLCQGDLPAGDRLMAAAAMVLCLTWGAPSAMTRAAIDTFGYLETLPETTPAQQCAWLSAKCYIGILEGDFAAYGLDWQKVGRISAESGLNFLATTWRLQYIWKLLLEGDLAGADASLRLVETPGSTKPVLQAFHCMVSAWLALLRGQSEVALVQAEELIRYFPATARTVRVVVVLNIYATALAACGHWDRALEVSLETTGWFPMAGPGVIQFVSLLTHASILRGLGRKDAFLAVLKEAFATGSRGGHFVGIPWFPKIVAQLAESALAEGIEIEYVRQLVALRGLQLGTGD